MDRSLLLYDYPLSLCCQMARLVLAEKGVPYEKRMVDIGAACQQFESWYLELNPQAVVPTLVDGDRAVTDTIVIAHYIDSEFPGPELAPEAAHAAIDRWMREIMAPSYGVLMYSPTVDEHGLSERIEERGQMLAELAEQRPEAAAILRERLEGNRSLRGILRDRAQTRAVIDGVAGLPQQMAASLADHPFLAGPSYTLADAFATAALARFRYHGLEVWWEGGALPAVADYYRRMKARPSFVEAGVVETESG